MILIAVSSYILPTGQFDRVESPLDDKKVIDPGTYHSIEAEPISLKDLMTAIPVGFVESADIIIFVFAAGGAFGVLPRTGIINLGINSLSKRFSTKPHLLVIFLMI